MNLNIDLKEISDPWSFSALLHRKPKQLKQFIGKIKRHILANPIPLSIPSPVIGYTGRTSKCLKKRALISYLARPFYMSVDQLCLVPHSNFLQSIEIANALVELGYIVDIVDWQDSTFTPTSYYDIFLGMHHNFERLLPYLNRETKKVYLATGAYWKFEQEAELKRLENLKKRRGIQLSLPVRLQENNWVEVANAVLVIGNQFTLSTYLPHNLNSFQLNNFATPLSQPNLEEKNFLTARSHFLALPSRGLLHKGLDLLLEVFSRLPTLHLWVCGPLESLEEQDFVHAYRRELFHTPNIHPVGWIDLHSEQFRQLSSVCASVAFPSCSEGMSGGVLNCMSQGLIPLVSYETGIDIPNNSGIVFEDCTLNQLEVALTSIANQDPETCRAMAQKTYKLVKQKYSLASFKSNMLTILAQIEQ